MTFIPLLGYYILRPGRKATPPIEDRRHKGFSGWYFRLGQQAIKHRWKVAFGSLGCPGRWVA